MKTARLKPVPKNDIDRLEARRDSLINKLAGSTTRLRRAQSIHDRMLSQLLSTQKRIQQLRDHAATIARLINGGKE